MRRLALIVVLCLSSTALAGVRLKLSAPGELVGDGRTVPLTLTVEPPADASSLGNLTIDADAGTVGATRQLEPGKLEVDFTPPRVALALDVHVTAAFAGGRTPPTVVHVLPAPVDRGEQRPGGAFDLRAPARLVAGDERPVTISVKKTAKRPHLVVNVGELGPWREEGNRLKATYQPPSKRFPQVVLLAAYGDDGAIDWLTVPFYGIGRVRTRTEPLARLTVSVAGAAFGPVRADATGAAAMAVVAPPGVSTGQAHAVDRVGNENDAPIDLGTPPFSRLLAVCAADGVHLLSVDATGAPATVGAQLTASAGTPSVPEPRAVGESLARVRGFDDDVQVTASLADSPVSTSRCTLHPPPSPPRKLSLALSRPAFVAGSGAVEIVATVEREPGRKGAIDIAFHPDFGRVVDVVPTADGARARWLVPDRLDGRSRATLKASVATVAAEASLSLSPGAPAKLEAQGPPHRPIADGRSLAHLRARVTDAFGNVVAAPTVSAQGAGNVTAARPDADGTVALDYRVPFLARGGDERITLTDGSGVTSTVQLRLRAPRRPFAVGAQLGYLTNFGKLSAPLLLVDFAWRPPILSRNFSVGVETGFYDASYHEAGTQPIDLTVVGVPILVRVDYQVPIGPIALFAGVGGGALVPAVSTSGATPASGSSGAAGAFAARLGSDVDVRFGRVLVELGYLYAPRADSGLSGNFGGLFVTAGYRLEL